MAIKVEARSCEGTAFQSKLLLFLKYKYLDIKLWGGYIHLTITVVILSFTVSSYVHLQLIGSVKFFTTVILQYLCAFVPELSTEVRIANSTAALSTATGTQCMLRNLRVFLCSLVVL